MRKYVRTKEGGPYTTIIMRFKAKDSKAHYDNAMDGIAITSQINTKSF